VPPLQVLFWKLEGLGGPLLVRVQSFVPLWELEPQLVGVALEQAGNFLASVPPVSELGYYNPSSLVPCILQALGNGNVFWEPVHYNFRSWEPVHYNFGSWELVHYNFRSWEPVHYNFRYSLCADAEECILCSFPLKRYRHSYH